MTRPRYRSLSLVCAAALLALLAPGRAAAAGDLRIAQPDAGRFPTVRLYLYPTDAAGQPVEGLRQEQFRVTEDGRPAEIRELRADHATPLLVSLVIDRSGSMQAFDAMRQAREAARRFVDTLGPADEAAALSFGDSVTIDQALTADHPLIHAAIDRLLPAGMTPLYDAIYWGIDQVGLRPQGGDMMASAGARQVDARRAVLALTDGQDNASRVRPEDVTRFARSRGVTVYVIGLGRQANHPALAALAEETGGEFHYAPTAAELDAIYQRMADRFRAEYRLTYRTPRPQRDGSRREVEVEIDAGGSGLPTGATWYQAPGPGSLLVTVPPEDGEPLAGRTAGGPPAPLGRALLLLAALLLLLGGTAWAFRGRLRPPSSAPAVPAAPPPAPELPPLSVAAPLTRIGRGSDLELHLPAARVSRLHARIEAREDGFLLVDEGSSNGTYVNGQRVEHAFLEPGDEVAFADQRFRFVGLAPEAEAAPDPEPLPERTTVLAEPRAEEQTQQLPDEDASEPPRAQ